MVQHFPFLLGIGMTEVWNVMADSQIWNLPESEEDFSCVRSNGQYAPEKDHKLPRYICGTCGTELFK